jgi:hypothetical protein
MQPGIGMANPEISITPLWYSKQVLETGELSGAHYGVLSMITHISPHSHRGVVLEAEEIHLGIAKETDVPVGTTAPIGHVLGSGC